MDPDEALDVIRAAIDAISEREFDSELDRLLVESFTALDEWLQNGGFKPRDWS